MAASKWTPERRKAASEAAKARLTGNTATAERPLASSDPLKDLAALIVQATSKDAEETKVLDQFTALIGRIDFKKHPELRDHPAMQSLLEKAFDREDDLPQANDRRVAPGTVRGEGVGAQATPWTWEHVNFLADQEPDGMFRRVKFQPESTQTVIWNGLQVWFAEGIESTYHKNFVDIYLAQRAGVRDADRHKNWLLRKGPWSPNVPIEMQPEPPRDWLEDEGFRMRSNADAGIYSPGAGWNPAVDGKRFDPRFGLAPDGVEPIETPISET